MDRHASTGAQGRHVAGEGSPRRATVLPRRERASFPRPEDQGADDREVTASFRDGGGRSGTPRDPKHSVGFLDRGRRLSAGPLKRDITASEGWERKQTLRILVRAFPGRGCRHSPLRDESKRRPLNRARPTETGVSNAGRRRGGLPHVRRRPSRRVRLSRLRHRSWSASTVFPPSIRDERITTRSCCT